MLRLAAPSLYFDAVVGTLKVREGDAVRAGEVVAVLEHHAVMAAAADQAQAALEAKRAAVGSRRAELDHARLEQERRQRLHSQGLVTTADLDAASSRLRIAESELQQIEREIEAEQAALVRSRLERDRALVRAPITGRVLVVHARDGEQVSERGILELAADDEMVVVAEVYEDDIGRVRVGQRATVRSPLLAKPLAGEVARVGRRIGKRDLLGTDPAARTDVRVVEVEVALADAAPVRALIHLTVDVEIEP